MIKKLLIANRGEIACRIIRTCQKLGIKSIAIASQADATSQAMLMADEGVVIGPAEASASYLDMDKVIATAKHFQADAIHPGYGFLSENADFAEKVRAAGLIFVGPSAEAIRLMGSKSEAKAIAEQAGVPIIKGYSGEKQSLECLAEEAARIGYPILVKATFGGGGKGMRRVDSQADLKESLEGCQREAKGAFGRADVLLEKYIHQPRHIEVQIFGDAHGNYVTLAERDCSLQRRHQKIIEEAPAAGLSMALKERLAEAAKAIARAVAYEGAGTVEFLVQGEDYYFLEMNTRLQVEHPVTEQIFGLDLVEWQLCVAAGAPLPKDIPLPQGHAIEVRLYAEDPSQNFLPSIGRLERFDLPDEARLDSGFTAGDMVTPFYDPMLAKITVTAANRSAAYTQLARVLLNTHVQGVKTNLTFLQQLIRTPAVCRDLPDTGYIDRSREETAEIPSIIFAVAVLWDYLRMQKPRGLWDAADGWRLNQESGVLYRFKDHEPVLLTKRGDRYTVQSGDHVQEIETARVYGGDVFLLVDGQAVKGCVVETAGVLTVLVGEHCGVLQVLDHEHGNAGDEAGAHLNAPMPGRVITVMVTDGQDVEAGAPLLVLEAMKMEHTIRAPFKGRVERVLFATGDFVEEGVELARMAS